MFTKRGFQFAALLLGLVLLVGTASPAFAKVASSRDDVGWDTIVNKGTIYSAPVTGEVIYHLAKDEHRDVAVGKYTVSSSGGSTSGVTLDLSHPTVYRITTKSSTGSSDTANFEGVLRSER